MHTRTHETVADCLGGYVAGAVEGDSQLMRRAMHPDAQIFGYLDGELLAGPMQLLYDYVDDHDGAGDALRWTATAVDETNGVASARLVIENWHGHTFTDYFTLLKTDGGWRVISKVFSHS